MAQLSSSIRTSHLWLLLALLVVFPHTAHAACATMNVPDAYTTPSTSPMASGGSISIAVDYRCDPFGLNPQSDVIQPAHGTVTLSGGDNTVIHYTNNGDGATSDSFVVEDASGFPFTVNVTIAAATSPITVSPASLPAPNVGTAYSQTLSASGGNAPYSYAVTGGSLPSGLSLSGATISGTPNQAGPATVTITVTDATSATTTKSYSPTVPNPSSGITVAAPATASLNSPYSYDLNANTSGALAPYSYSQPTSGALPPGLSLSGTTISGTPTSTGTYNFSLTVTDSSPNLGGVSPGPYFKSVNLSITVQNTPPTAGAVSATVAYGSSNNPITLNITGGTATSVAIGTAAAHGMATASGTSITYTPTAGYAGPDSFTYTATNGSGTSAPATVTITVSPPTISYTPSSPAAGTVGAAYSQSLAGASGGTGSYTYAIASGSLPAGLSLASNGTVSGTPTAGGSFNFTVTATDSSTGTGPFSATSGTLTLTVNAPSISYAPSNPVAGTVGAAYSQSLASASGGTSPYSYSLASGSPPAGLSLASDGTLSGTPTAGGSFTFSVTATDSSTGTGPFSATSGTLTLTVNAASITVSPAMLSNPTVGAAYSQTITASGGIGPYTYAIVAGALPAGLSLSTTGTLSGTPTAAGSFNVAVLATDSSTGTGPYAGSQAYTVTVNGPSLTLAPSSGTTFNGTAGSPVSASFTAGSGTGPYSYTISAGALPSGVTLSTSGALSGTPTVAGSFNFAVTATDSSTGTGAPFTVSSSYVLNVVAPTVTLSPSSLPAASIGTAYSQTLSASGGSGSYSYAITGGALPAGLSLSGGTLSGTPTAAGSFGLTVTATDGLGFTGSQAYTLAIIQPLPVAGNDTASVMANAAVAIAVTTNDTGPIDSIAVVQVPAHGVATVNGLEVTYTPVENYFGSDAFTYVAVGPGGTSAPATVNITVTPLAVPVAAAQAVTVLAGQAITIHAAAGAANGPFTAASVVRAPASGSVVVQGTDIVYTADPDASGTVDFDYTVSNAFGASVSATITVTVNPRPVAPALTATAIAGAAVRVDLTTQAHGGPFTAASVVSMTPADAGTVAIDAEGNDGYVLVFTPAASFGGAVRITYTLSNAFAISALGTVDITVTLRSDPSKNAEVVGILGAQAESARRMALGQISNFQRRLESLHGGHPQAGFSNGISLSSVSSQRRRMSMSDNMRHGIGSGAEPLWLSSGHEEASDASVPAPARGEAAGGFSFWSGGAVNFGKLQPGGDGGGIDFTTSGLSLGADKRVTETLALGVGLGYGHDASDIGRHGSRSALDSYNIAVYGSFQPGATTFIDALLGYQWLQFDARRFVVDNGAVVHGRRDGRQWFASLSTGYRLQTEDVLLTPYGRLDLARAMLDGYTERGDALYALSYLDQTIETSTGTLGLLSQWTLKRDYGIWAPQLRAEFSRDLQRSDEAAMRYADLLSGPLYQARLRQQFRSHGLLGAGVELRTLKGWSLRAEYQVRMDSSSRDDQTIQIGVEKALPPP